MNAVTLTPILAALFPIAPDQLLRRLKAQIGTSPDDQVAAQLDELQEMVEQDGTAENPAFERIIRRYVHTERSYGPSDHLDALLVRYEPDDGPDYSGDYWQRQDAGARWDAWRCDCADQARAEWRRNMRDMLDALMAALATDERRAA